VERIGLINGHLLAPLFLGAALTMNDIHLSAVPHWLTGFAQLMFGLILGSRFERAFFQRHKLFVPFAIVNACFVMLVSAAVAVALAWSFGLSLSTMLISTAPGGLAEMTIAAQALQISVPTVIAFHMFRVIVVNFGTQYLYGLAMGLGARIRRKAKE
jgi:membrane AbrB-like protein